MSSVKTLESTPQPSPGQKPPISVASEMLTPSELAQLERVAIETADSAHKAFPGLKILR